MPWPPAVACRRVALVLFGTALAMHLAVSLLVVYLGGDLRTTVVVSELVALLGLSAWLARRMRLPLRQAFALHPAALPHFAAAALAALPIQALGASINQLILDALSERAGMRRMIEETLRQLTRIESAGDLLMLMTAGVLVAAVCEEVLFRGLVLQLLARHGGWARAMGWSALLFAAFHLDPVGFVPRAGIGVWLAALVWRSGSLWPAITAHAANNGVALFGVVMLGPSAEAPHPLLTLAVSAVAVVAIVVIWLRSTRPRPPVVR